MNIAGRCSFCVIKITMGIDIQNSELYVPLLVCGCKSGQRAECNGMVSAEHKRKLLCGHGFFQLRGKLGACFDDRLKIFCFRIAGMVVVVRVYDDRI